MSDCPANGEWVSSGFTTSMPMGGTDSVNTCMNAGLDMAEGVKLSVMNGNMVYVCCVPRSVETEVAWALVPSASSDGQLGTFPDECYKYGDYYADLDDGDGSGYTTNYETCKAGDIMVAQKICCPISVWQTFEFN